MLDPKNWMGDKGYIGNGMITPFRKPEGRELLDWQKEFNAKVNKIRWMIEQVISHFRTRPFCTRLSATAQHLHNDYLSRNWLFLGDSCY